MNGAAISCCCKFLQILQFNLKPLHIRLPHSKISTGLSVTLLRGIYVTLLTKYFLNEDDSSEVERSLKSEDLPIIALQGANHLLGVLSKYLKGISRLCPLSNAGNLQGRPPNLKQ